VSGVTKAPEGSEVNEASKQAAEAQGAAELGKLTDAFPGLGKNEFAGKSKWVWFLPEVHPVIRQFRELKSRLDGGQPVPPSTGLETRSAYGRRAHYAVARNYTPRATGSPLGALHRAQRTNADSNTPPGVAR
jgi:hypothetical protein